MESAHTRQAQNASASAGSNALDLNRALKVLDRLLNVLRLNVVRAKPADGRHVAGKVAKGFVVVLKGLALVVHAVKDVAEVPQHIGVGRQQGKERGVPLDGLVNIPQALVGGSQLVDDLDAVGQHGMQLGVVLEAGLQVAQPLVYQAWDGKGGGGGGGGGGRRWLKEESFQATRGRRSRKKKCSKKVKRRRRPTPASPRLKSASEQLDSMASASWNISCAASKLSEAKKQLPLFTSALAL